MDVSSYKYTEPKKLQKKVERIEDSKEALIKINSIIGWLSSFEDLTEHLNQDDPKEYALYLAAKGQALDTINKVVHEKPV
jgi:hypothetical protein